MCSGSHGNKVPLTEEFSQGCLFSPAHLYPLVGPTIVCCALFIFLLGPVPFGGWIQAIVRHDAAPQHLY